MCSRRNWTHQNSRWTMHPCQLDAVAAAKAESAAYQTQSDKCELRLIIPMSVVTQGHRAHLPSGRAVSVRVTMHAKSASVIMIIVTCVLLWRESRHTCDSAPRERKHLKCTKNWETTARMTCVYTRCVHGPAQNSLGLVNCINKTHGKEKAGITLS